jgi:hypothetical protein
MRTSRVLSSARVRFLATVATVFALVAMGGVTSAPAFAANVGVTVTVTNVAQGGVIPNTAMTLQTSDGLTSYSVATNSSGTFYTGSIPEGDYRLLPPDPYSRTGVFTFVAGQTVATVPVSKTAVYGSIPASAGSGHTSVMLEMLYLGNWSAVASFMVNNADGTFGYMIQTPHGQYRLYFEPDASVAYFGGYSSAFTVDGSVESVNIGATSLPSAGTISGTVLSTSSTPVTNATVHAKVNSVESTVATNGDGEYMFKFAASPMQAVVWATSPTFKTEYFMDTSVEASAIPVQLTSGFLNPTGIDFSLTPEPADLSGNLASSPSGVDALLYKANDVTGLYPSTPYLTDDSTFEFTDLADGTYRLAFRNASTLETLVTYPGWANGAPGGECYLELSINSADGNVTFPELSYGSPANDDYCAAPAYVDPGDAAVSGTVTNYTDLSGTVWAKLYTSSGALVDSSSVDLATGAFTLSGVPASGDYYITFLPTSDPYLPALLGDGNYTELAKDQATEDDFAASHSFAVDVDDSSTLIGHDVALTRGALVYGSVVSGADAVVGGVNLTDVNTGETYYAPITGSSFSLLLPLGGTYTIFASSTDGDFAAEYWENATVSDDATLIGPLTSGDWGPYDFDLDPSPAALFGYVRDLSSSDPITAHLYFKDGGGVWREVGEQDSEFLEVYFTENYTTGDPDGLVPGEYRMRFENANGDWLAATEYATGLVPAPWNSTVTGPACFVDVTVAPGLPTAIDATFDFVNQAETCAAEPLVDGDVTGRFIWDGTVLMANQEVSLNSVNSTDWFNMTTGADGVFTFEDVPNGTYDLGFFPQDDHIDGNHEYSYYERVTFIGGDIDLDDLEPIRYGNVTGTISDWDNDTMAGATATVYAPCGCGDSWDIVEPYMSVEIDEFGHFEAPGVGLAGDYSVLIEPAEDSNAFVPKFVLGGLAAPDDPFTSAAEQDYDYGSFALDPDEFVVISGTVFFGEYPVSDGQVFALPADGSLFGFDTYAQEDGSYELLVAPNVDYFVVSENYSLYSQVYNGINLDPDYDPADPGDVVAVGVDPVTGINFSMTAPEDVWFSFDAGTYAGSPGSSYALYDVQVHLYKYVIDGWEEVDVQSTNAYAELHSSGDGEYRLRLSKNGEWLSIDKVRWDNALPPYEVSDGYDDYDNGGTTETDSCYLDFESTAHGSDINGSILVDDPTLLSCGPETLAEHYTVNGTVTSTSAFAYAPIEGQTVTLTNDATSNVITTTTDVDGLFSLDSASPGTYTLAFPTTDLGDHTYVERSVEVVVVNGDVQLDPLELVRYGNADVQVLNWDNAAMAGTTAQLYTVSGSSWQPTGLPSTVDATGNVAVRGISADGEYSVYFDYPTGLLDAFLTNIDVEAQTFTGTAEQDATADTYALTTITGNVHTGVLAVNGADIEADGWSGPSEFTTTDAGGNYEVVVPAGRTYQVVASKVGLVSDMLTTVEVDYIPETGADLELHYAIFTSRVFEDDGLGNTTALTGSTAHLYKQVTGGWQEVAFDGTFGPSLWTNLSGNYRLRFSNGADWLSIDSYEWANGAAPAPGFALVDPNPAACYIDFSPAVAGAEYQIDLITPETPAVTCAAEPAVVAPPVTPGSTGSSKPKPAATTTDTTVDDETEEESTATPTPEPSGEGDGGDEVVDDKSAPTSAPDFTWLFWGSGLLALLLLAGGAVFFVRRRS